MASRRLFVRSKAGDTSAGSSIQDIDNDGPPKKKLRQIGFKYRPKLRFKKPYVGFENANLKPVPRTSLHIDQRFFHFGIQPGTIWEIKGPAKSGKTFLLTYLIVRVLNQYPEKKVVLIDTRHKFNVQNFTSILYHVDEELKKTDPKAHRSENARLLHNSNTRVDKYLDRISIIKCYSPEDLMLTVGPSGESTLENLLLHDPKVSLVAVDAIDNYSYSEFMAGEWADQWPNVMHSLKQCVSNTRCPVICTTMIPANKCVYLSKPGSSQNSRTMGGSKSESQQKQELKGDTGNSGKNADSASRKCSQVEVVASSKQTSQEIVKTKKVERNSIDNFQLDYTTFTNILEIVPSSEAAKEKLSHMHMQTYNCKISHFATAYLRSRQSANTAGSGGNHRVKFSIFSDMLWVEK